MFAVTSTVRERTVTTILTIGYDWCTRLIVFTWWRITCIEHYNVQYTRYCYTVGSMAELLCSVSSPTANKDGWIDVIVQ